MKAKTILSILKIGATVLFYFLLCITLIIAGSYIIKLYKNSPKEYMSIDFGKSNDFFIDLNAKSKNTYSYSPDQLLRYKSEPGLYTVDIKPHSTIGYYYMASTLLFLCLGLLVLWNFQKVFKEIKLDSPFKATVVKHLQTLALIYIISDILGFIHYFILDALIKNSLEVPRLKHITDVGGDILVGLIILIIAVVYKRGLEIHEENSLTV